MSSRSNSDSEEEDVQDMLARIKKNLNNDDSDKEDSSDNEDSDKEKKENLDKKPSSDDDNDEDGDDEKPQINDQKDNQVNEESQQSNNEKQVDEQEEKQTQQQENKVISNQEDEEDDDDDDEIESGLNINSILIQNGIVVESLQKSPNLKQQKSKQDEQKQQQQIVVETQIQQTNDGSASPTKSPTKKAENQQNKGNESPSKIDDNSKQIKENIFTVVRVDAEKKEEVVDHILQDLDNIKIKRALLEDQEIISFKIDSSPLEQTMEQVKKKYDENVGKYMVKQKTIFDRIKEISKRSVGVYDQVNTSNKTFLKKKVSDKEKYVKEIQKLQSESSKTKTFLIMMIQRLESIELEIDKFTDAKLKEINRKNQNDSQMQQQQQQQQLQQQPDNNEPVQQNQTV